MKITWAGPGSDILILTEEIVILSLSVYKARN